MTETPRPPQARLRLLLDSNIVLAAEPYGGVLEPAVTAAATLVRLSNELGHLLCVAPATRDDILQNTNKTKRDQRLAELQKFVLLEEVPLARDLVSRAGESAPGTNDHRDLRLLAALNAGAVNYLVTEDRRLAKRGRRAGLAESILSLRDAVELLESFVAPASQMPPRVERIAAYALDAEQPIFDSLRQDYPDFDEWLGRVRRDSANRVCFVVRVEGDYAGIALLKNEEDTGYALPGPALKISTFKVSAEYSEQKFGELLLKSIFLEAHDRKAAALYVEMFERQERLRALLGFFGFKDGGARSARGELVLVKRLIPDDEAEKLSDLDYQIAYGPPALRLRQKIYIVPVLPVWHEQLFPELGKLPTQSTLFEIAPAPVTHPWGNALTKAYLCNSPTKSIIEGDVVLFYRSRDDRSVTVAGIVESVKRSSEPDVIAQFVGRRTVYTLHEISAMSRRVDGVLAIRFRQDRILSRPIAFEELKRAGVLNGSPRSITRVREGSRQWLRHRLDE